MTISLSGSAVVRQTSMLALAAACLVLLAGGGCNSQDTAAKEKEGGEPTSVKPLTTADEVMAAMAAAYRNAKAYSDQGSVRLVADMTEEKMDQTAKLSVQFARPNKLRLEAYHSVVAIDGKTYRATLENLPDQIVVKDVPETLTWNQVYADQYLAQDATRGFGGDAPQLTLLLERDALRAILGDADKPEMAEPGEIDGRKYYRVKVRRPEGASIFWIDQQTFVLRRFEYPTDEFYEVLSRQSPVKSLSMVADFVGARFDTAPKPSAFELATPAGAVEQRFFLPPSPAQLLGKPAPDFTFTDLEGREVTRQSLAGKIVVLDFWGVQCGPCRQVLPAVEKVYQGYQGSNVAILAVNVDAPQTPVEELTGLFQKLDVTVPIVRDLKNQLPNVFRTAGIPCMFIIDAAGKVQHFESGPNPDLATQLVEKLEELRAGRDIFAAPLAEYKKSLDQYSKMIDLIAAGRSVEQAMAEIQDTPRATLAERTQPRHLRLSPLWTNSDVKLPGNLILLPSKNGATIGVIDGCKGVTEIGLDGKTIAQHRLLSDDSEEVITMLRLLTTPSGQRHMAAFAGTQQRFHWVDENWRVAFSFPQDALENRHSGIADVELADLDADGVPEAYVGYFGVVGVQAVSIEGKRTASYRQIANVMRMATSGPDPQGARALYCINNAGPIVVLDSKLQRLGEVIVPDRGVSWIVAAELTGNPQPQYCGLLVPRPGETIAIGLDAGGQELWNYALPEGLHEQPIEPIVAGRLSGNAGQWILPGCDGSIHVLSHDGQLVDRFNYGKALAGVMTAELDGQPILIVASPGIESPDGSRTPAQIEAWRVE